MTTTPAHPKAYHIVHVDNLQSIISDNALLCDAAMAEHNKTVTTIGMSHIKAMRQEKAIACHPGLFVGGCVPFYFCPRSVMLYVIYMGNPELAYREGQGPIIHLEADLRQVVAWADAHGRRWAFTTSNAAAAYAEDYSDLEQLDQIDWGAVQAPQWSSVKERKQAEFLVEQSFPWQLVSRIGVRSPDIRDRALAAMQGAAHRPPVEIKRDWYY